jgi:potassium channel
MLLKRYVFKQLYGKNAVRDMFGEVSALCNIPHPFTCRTAELSQLLRISKTKLTEIMHEHSKDNNIVMTNLL